MKLKFIKNTVLLFVVVLLSCGNRTTVKNESFPIVGANQLALYLPFLDEKNIGVKIRNGNMPVESYRFVANFLLQTYTYCNRNKHYYNTNHNCCYSYFYYWCRNTTFIGLCANDAFCDEKFEIQIKK